MAEIRENNETAQRAELYRKIWSIADDVRGAVDDRSDGHSLYLSDK